MNPAMPLLRPVSGVGGGGCGVGAVFYRSLIKAPGLCLGFSLCYLGTQGPWDHDFSGLCHSFSIYKCGGDQEEFPHHVIVKKRFDQVSAQYFLLHSVGTCACPHQEPRLAGKALNQGCGCEGKLTVALRCMRCGGGRKGSGSGCGSTCC